MLRQEQAIELAQGTLRASRAMRSHYDSVWALNLAYAAGKQWSWIQAQSAGQRQLERLHEILDPRRTDVRVTLDMVARSVRRVVASLKPQKISAVVHPRGGSSAAMIAKHVFTGLLARRLREIDALAIWRGLHRPRCILGVMGVRRQITTNGRPITLPMGSSRKDQQKALYNRQVSWAPVLPFEVVRDPSAISCDMDGETTMGLEKARPVYWVQKNFGVEVQTEQTMGDLYGHLDQMRKATGWTIRAHAGDSRVPGVMVYEWFFKDADAEREWPYHLIAYLDPEEASQTRLVPLHWGDNPFFGRPIHFLQYETRINEPWPAGIPALMKGAQDIRNMAATAMLRVMIASYPQWRVEKSTMEEAQIALMSRMDRAIEFQRRLPTDHIPDRVQAPGASPVSENFFAITGQEGEKAAGIAPVQHGQQVARGQSGEAYREVIEQAEVPLNDLRKDDEGVLNDLLYGTLIDTVKITLRPRRDIARRMLGDEFTTQQIATALGSDPEAVIESVTVLPETIRPRTPRQVKEDMTDLVQKQVKPAREAEWEMLRQGDVVTDSRMAAAKRKQEMEITMLLAGGQPQVVGGEDHETGIRVLEELMSSPRWESLSPEQRDAISFHWAQHRNAAMQLAEWAQQMEMGSGMEARGSPPAERPEPQGAGAVGPAVQVA